MQETVHDHYQRSQRCSHHQLMIVDCDRLLVVNDIDAADNGIVAVNC